VTPTPRRGRVLLGLAVVAAVLVGGRWFAVETAERAWAATVAAGAVYLTGRDLARLVDGLILLVAIAWGTGNLFYVYLAIGSVQLPRRLGDLEIVEAVPQRVLLAATLASGLVYGLLLTLGTGDWWLRALLASRPPHFGVVDPVLGHDVGYYVGQLPWALTCQRFALLASATSTILVALLYLGIGSLRWSGWRPVTSPHARGHLGVLLAVLAAAFVGGAILDPAAVVAGGRGPLAFESGVLAVRLSGARWVSVLGIGTILASLWWGMRDTARALGAAWGVLAVAAFGAYVALPALARGGVPPAASTREVLRRLAFGADWQEERWPRGFPSVARAAAALPLWDEDRVLAATRGPGALRAGAGAVGVTLDPAEGEGAGGSARAAEVRWVVVPPPASPVPPPDDDGARRSVGTAFDWAALHRGALTHTSPPVVAVEGDSALSVRPLATRDSAFWFGAGIGDYAVAAPDSWPALHAAAIPLLGWWRRTALAWVLQSPELVRHESDGLVLVWRRDVIDRLERLAPFAAFEAPTPRVVDGVVWWLAYGYVSSETFPLVDTVSWPGHDRSVRYLRAGLLGAVDAASGATHLYLAPGADSLSAAWARLFTPLILPFDSLPAALRRVLPFPRNLLQLAAARLLASAADSAPWRATTRGPYEVRAPRDSEHWEHWRAQGFERGSPPALAALLAGTMRPTGPDLRLWRAVAPMRLPPELLGSPQTAPGFLRLWSAAGTPVAAQALFDQPAASGVPRGVSQVYLTWGEREGEGPTRAVAVRTLLTAGARGAAPDTALATRWEVARRLAARADSALKVGDLEAFSRFDAELRRVLTAGRALAPARQRR